MVTNSIVVCGFSRQRKIFLGHIATRAQYHIYYIYAIPGDSRRPSDYRDSVCVCVCLCVLEKGGWGRG